MSDTPGHWTIDSLNEHLTQRMDAMEEASHQLVQARLAQHDDTDKRNQQRFDAQEKAVQIALAEADKRYEQRFRAQESAVALAQTEADKRYTQRFDAQQLGIVASLDRISAEFHERLQSVRAESIAALAASDKAITKSEAASEARFASVNEFRQTLTDQAHTFMPRSESEQRHGTLNDKLDALGARQGEDTARITTGINESLNRFNNSLNDAYARLSKEHNEALARVNSRLDLTQGKTNGIESFWGIIIGAVGLVGGIIAIVIGMQ